MWVKKGSVAVQNGLNDCAKDTKKPWLPVVEVTAFTVYYDMEPVNIQDFESCLDCSSGRWQG